MNAIIEQFFNISIMAQAWPSILSGLWVTLKVCLVVIPLGLIGGLLVSLICLSSNRFFSWPAIFLVDLLRAIPPLVLLIFVYSGLPFAGIRLEPFTAVALAFLLNNSAYYGEVYRAGIMSVDRGQSEAARSTGMSASSTFIHVVLPQAVRNVLPDLLSNTIEVVKLTSLASVVSLGEMLHRADMARSITYNASPIVLAGVVYLVLLIPFVRLVSYFERRTVN
ncbi:MAG: amino acid ABC transporter permease [Granulosicoccus sp.]